MINLEEAKKEFLKYVNQFDVNDERITQKMGHSLRVMENSRKLAQNIGLEEEKINLATLIGLLHDIGRFEQHVMQKKQKDAKFIDHGDLGVEILKKDNYIRKYIHDDKYDTIIFKSIENHSKYKINPQLNKEELFFAKMIRDCDKLDIFYETTDLYWRGQEEKIENCEISDYIFDEFEKQKTIEKNREKQKNELETIISVIAFLFDINFKESFEIIKNEKYIDKIVGRFNYKKEKTKEQMETIKNTANNYIEKKIKS